MLDVFILVGLVINVALLVVILRRLQRGASKQDIPNLTHLVWLERAKALVENVEKVKKGNTIDEIRSVD